MGKHLPYNKKMKLTRIVLDGLSFAQAARDMNVSASTAQDIVKAHSLNFFTPSEIDKFKLERSNISACRAAWRSVYNF